MSGIRFFRWALLLSLICVYSSAQAVEIEGVRLADRIEQAGQTLVLNGAGVRSNFFFDIYVGALYLPAKSKQAEAILQHPAPSRISISMLYEEVLAEKLSEGWRTGFLNNQDAGHMQALAARLDAFCLMFVDSRRGDVFNFDFLPDGSTLVTYNGMERGRVAGSDFQSALLAVWLGQKPADKSLKKSLLDP